MTMLLEAFKSEGLAHISYMLGHQGEAAIIDPRRDIEAYLDLARQNGLRITHIFETHRNEDYVIGSVELARKTGATIHHGAAMDFAYGNAVSEGDTFKVGDLELRVLETPGHTPESISLVMADTSTAPEPLGVFTGDALFIGDVGRTDFYEPVDRWAEALYDSIHEKLLPLGDQTILYPAHGAGSVCGAHMAQREFSTIGYERRHNRMLQLGRDAFIRAKREESHDRPPYFLKMEEHNQQGNPRPLDDLAFPTPMAPGEVSDALEKGTQVVDIRSPEAFAGAFIPGSTAIPLNMLAPYAGFFLSYDADIILVAENVEQVSEALTTLRRIGYDRVTGHLRGGLTSWEVAGLPYDTIPAVHVDSLVDGVQNDSLRVLDVRKPGEVEGGMLPGAIHIPLAELMERMDELPKDELLVAFCGSGMRAIIAASLLKGRGFGDVGNSLGSMAACRMRGCPIK